MLQDLKRKTLIAKLPALLISLAAAIALAVYLAPTALAVLRGPGEIYPEAGIDIDALEGQYLAGDIDYIFDWYVETVEEKSGGIEHTTARSYIVPVFGEDGDTYYIGVEVPASLMGDAEAVLEDTERWMFDEDYVWDGSLLSVRGTVHTMDAETADYYYEVLRGFGMEEDDKGHFLPLVLVHGDIGNANQGIAIFAGIVLAALLVYFIWALAACLGGAYQRNIRAYLSARPDPDGDEHSLDLMYESETQADPKQKVLLDRSWLVYINGAQSFVAAVADIAWVYHNVTRHRVNGIPTGKTHSVIVCTASEKTGKNRHTIATKSEDAAQALIADIHRVAMNAAYGYNAAWDAPFNADARGFQSQVIEAARSAAAAGAAPAQTAQPAPAAPQPAPEQDGTTVRY